MDKTVACEQLHNGGQGSRSRFPKHLVVDDVHVLRIGETCAIDALFST